MTTSPHLDVARRFDRFLQEVNLNRESFAAAVDGAITSHSLFSILNGHRRPSRALAVLIERTWGFRADFLLDGKGEMWTQPAYGSSHIGGTMLSPLESAVVEFMRGSVDNARAMDEQLEVAETWAGLASWLRRLADETVASADSSSPDERAAYPLLLSMFLEEVRWATDQHSQFTSLLRRLQVEKLLEPILKHCLVDIPGSILEGEELERIRAAVEPLSIRRVELSAALEDAAARIRSSFRALRETEPMTEAARTHAHRARQRRDHVNRLAELAASDRADQARELVEKLHASFSDQRLAGDWMARVVQDLSRETISQTPHPGQNPARDSSQARYSAIIENYTN